MIQNVEELKEALLKDDEDGELVCKLDPSLNRNVLEDMKIFL